MNMNKARNSKGRKSPAKIRNAAVCIAKGRNGGAMRHKNDRRKNDARNKSFDQDY